MLENKDGSGDKEKKRKRTIKIESSTSAHASDSKLDVKRIKAETPKVDQNTARSLFYAEEDEVEKRAVDKDTELFQSACEDIQKTIYEIKQLKDSKDKNTKAEIDSKRMEGMLQIVMLKKLNRLAHIRCKGVRDGTSEAKQRIDKCHLQLQNLLYEVMHLEKEITKCLEFKSKDEEIDLVTLDEFYEEAPAEVSKPELTKKDYHRQTLARLDWELEQRKKLASKLKDLEKGKGSMESEIKTQQDYLENLQPKLNTILQSTKPVQDYLKMPFDAKREEFQTAQYLPQPLYVLYMQTSAYKDACDQHLTVRLVGDVNAAKSLDLTGPFIPDEESDSDQDEQDEQDKKNSKRRRKTVEVRSSDRKSKILTKHPLSVMLEVNCKDGSMLCLTFCYLTYLKIITVTVKLTVASAGSTNVSGGDLLTPDQILTDLYPGDHGKTSPNHSSQYELARFGLGDFGTYIGQLGRPYLWAQWLGGLQFMQGEVCRPPQSSVSAANMQNTIKKIRCRIRSRLSLLKQLDSLDHKTIPVTKEHQGLFPVKLCSQLVSFQRSTRADFEEAPYTKAVLDAGLASDTDLYFTAVFERASAKLTARVVLAADYPAIAPVFCLNVFWQRNRNALNDSHVKDMEEEVNIHYMELVSKKSHDQLLTNQLQRLAMCFDVYLETESLNSEKEGPVEIPREKVFSRVARGPQRSKPYKYCSDSGIFSHR